VPRTTAADGCRLHYEVLGRPHAEPVLMIQGLGADRNGWVLQRFAFAAGHRVIVFDNRGVGRSDKPFARYSLEQMADDAAAVLDAAGVDEAHVVGASMGGAIAQLLAVRHPHRVRSLTLACTACSNPVWRRELLAEWASTASERGMREVSRRSMRWLVGQRSLRRFAPAIGLVGPLAMSCPPHAFVSQVRAILDTPDVLAEQLATITAPTLVLVGNQDVLTPRGDSEELAERIAGAELVVVSGAAHGFMVEYATTFNRIVLEFLAGPDGAGTGTGRRSARAN
jgi:3-oxoadipate enol-lactonase